MAFNIYADVVNAVRSELIGIAFCLSDDMTAGERIDCKSSSRTYRSFYIPLNHSNIESQLNKEDVLEVLKPFFENILIKKVTHNAKSAYNVLRCFDIFSKGIIFDTMLASYVKDPQRNHELDIQAMEHLGHAVVAFAPFEKDKKKQVKLNDAPIDGVLTYTCDMVVCILELTKFWHENLDEKELDIVYNIEVPLTFVLAQMEYDGVSVDEMYLASLTSSMNVELVNIEEKIYALAGCRFNINSPRQVR